MRDSVGNQYTIHGNNALELGHRVATLGAALERQHGTVVRVSYAPRASLLDPCSAVVHYTLPQVGA